MKTCQERLALAKAQGISDFYMLTLDNVCALLFSAHLPATVVFPGCSCAFPMVPDA
jgi:hypothetical protein